MKVYYQEKEVGLNRNVKKVIDMFGDGIRISPKHIIACKCNNEIKSLDYEIKDGDKVELIDVTDRDGMRVYTRGALFVVGMALQELYPGTQLCVNYKISNSTLCETSNLEITEKVVENLRKKVAEIIEKNLPIEKVNMTKKEAEEFYKKQNKDDMRGKLQVENTNKDVVTLYFCENYFNYFYGVMPLSTGYINLIDIRKYNDSFIIRYPKANRPTELGAFKESKKFLSTLQEYEQIHSLLGISTVKELNENIENGNGKDVILTAEALQEKKIAQIADQITQRKNLKVVLIAGPSSSSKTTFSKRLRMQLRVNGLNPVTLSTDDYFVERKDTPLDKNGEYNFEALEAIDLELFNKHLNKLISGETVEIPTFDFKVGTKRYNGKKMKLEENEILVVEGIHCLNDKLTTKVDKKSKFKIYISDLTVLNIDYYNRISTSDIRLLRRIVRDYNYRGYSALDTLKRWPSVIRGERKNIFPFQEEADVMFNSSLAYEISVLAHHALPLLREIDNTKPEYSEAKRLISLLEYFKPLDETPIPNNSLLREFIGGSVFDY